jgi:DNA-binding transcriptional MerR regulator
MDKHTYKIGEVASLLSTSIRSIRYYEEEGLLNPIRTQRGTRLYSKPHIIRLKVILRLVNLRFSIESIRNIIKIRENSKTGDDSSKQVNIYLNEILNNIAVQMKALKKLNTEINNAQKIIKKCHGCINHPSTKGCPNCQVNSKLNDIELLNLIWDIENDV